MPIHTDTSEVTDFADPDSVPRPVMGIGMSIVTDGMETGFHHHRKAQFFFTGRGIVSCEDAEGLWIVPPQCAIWIPAGMRHNFKIVGTFEGYCLYIDPDLAPPLQETYCTVSVTPLLRELFARCAELPVLYPLEGRESHLVTVLLDELAAAPVEKLHLPMPADDRLRTIAQKMMMDPSDRATAPEWARRIGVGERTLRRILQREIGMSFGRWRQQLHVILALQRLSRDASVQSVSDDLGYESASSFVTMFRKALGTSPARYMSQRLARKTKSAPLRPWREGIAGSNG
jgi:AraC-like DNA-binding protein